MCGYKPRDKLLHDLIQLLVSEWTIYIAPNSQKTIWSSLPRDEGDDQAIELVFFYFQAYYS